MLMSYLVGPTSECWVWVIWQWEESQRSQTWIPGITLGSPSAVLVLEQLQGSPFLWPWFCLQSLYYSNKPGCGTQTKPAEVITADLLQEPIEANIFFPQTAVSPVKRRIQMNWKCAEHFEKQMNKNVWLSFIQLVLFRKTYKLIEKITCESTF